MARSQYAPNGTQAHRNGGPPPASTLAAQIVQHRTQQQVADQSPSAEAATFPRLLHEILHNPAIAPETDIATNVKLINVVAEGCLGPLVEHTQLAKRSDVLVSQARDSIAVIKATVQRQPAVLSTTVSPDGPQLALPLLARLIAACGQQAWADLPIVQLIEAILTSLDGSVDLWNFRSTFVQVLQECVDEAISSLKQKPNESVFVVVRLPPARSVAKLWPQSQSTVTLPVDLQTSIDSYVHAFAVVEELASISSLPERWRADTVLQLRGVFKLVRQEVNEGSTLEPDYSSGVDELSMILNRVNEAAEALPSVNSQTRLAKSLFDLFDRQNGDAIATLLPRLTFLASISHFPKLCEHLRIAIFGLVVRSRCPNGVRGGMAGVHGFLQHQCVASRIVTNTEYDDLPRKRRRLNASEPVFLRQQNTPDLTKSLAEGINVHKRPGRSTLESYENLSEEKQHGLWQCLISLAHSDPAAAAATSSEFLTLTDLQLKGRSRILALLAVQECVQRMDNPTYVDLGTSILGQFCLKSLRSSSRDVRLAAGQCLPGFLRSELSATLTIKNRRGALEYLRALSERDVVSEHETLIGAWGNIALVCDDKELNLVLLRLVEYLGHSNPVISGLAYVEIERLAAKKQQTINTLFKPFWSSIAVSIIKDFQTRPQKIQLMCDLLAMEVNQFLLLTQEETIPNLVLTKRADLLGRIAVARGNSATVEDVCMQPRSSCAATIALLIFYHGPTSEKTALECLRAVTGGLNGIDLVSLIKSDPTLIAVNLLKITGDQPEEGKAKGYQAFHILATLVEKGPGYSKGQDSRRYVTKFFESHILGIMTIFSQILEDAQGMQPDSEKILSLKAIAEMILLARSASINALPQIRACLQSAIERDKLREAAFSAWLDMLSVLDGDDISYVMHQTFALIRNYWSQVSDELQQSIHEHVAELIKNHNQTMQENIMMIPNITGIPLLAKFAGEIERLRAQRDIETHLKAFTNRLKDESKIIVMRAVEELLPIIEGNQGLIHNAAISEQPSSLLSDLVRALLDATVKYSSEDEKAADLFGRALGLVGCLDPNLTEAVRKKRRVLVLSNFENASEVVDWAIVLLEDVLVKLFRSVSNAGAQGFVAYVIQEMLRFCGFNEFSSTNTRSTQSPTNSQRFRALPEHVRLTLTPLLSSRYMVTSANAAPPSRSYTGFSAASDHGTWLRNFVFHLMWKAKGENVKMVFPLLARLIRGPDLAITSFLLPYVVMNIILEGTVAEVQAISDEFIAILRHQPLNNGEQETVKLCSESVFSALDYMSAWLQEKRRVLGENRSTAFRTGHSSADFDEVKDMDQISIIEKFLAEIPADLMAAQAQLCGSHARALFHWEQHIRKSRPLIPSLKHFQGNTPDNELYDKLQEIYADIDEPDGLEGISAHLSFLTEDQQAIQHSKAGRWTAAQTWYEIQLMKDPGNVELEEKLLSCLRETGRHGPLMRYSNDFLKNSSFQTEDVFDLQLSRLMPLTLEAHWASGDLKGMSKWLYMDPINADTQSDVGPSKAISINAALATSRNFNIGISRALAAVMKSDNIAFASTVSELRKQTTQSLTTTGTSSVQACHEDLRKLHVLYEIEALRDGKISAAVLDRRLDVLGSYVSDKQYILGIRRAVIGAAAKVVSSAEIGASWLTTAKLARKSGNNESAYKAVLEAYECGIKSAKLEEARLLWRDGHQRHAIQALEAAINSGIFDSTEIDVTESSDMSGVGQKQNMLSAKAHLLMAKWLDASGQRQAKELTEKYQYAAKFFQRWEKGHYYLGKHYQKLLEAEKLLPESKQTSAYLSGDLTRLVIENQMRSIPFGNKYWHQTIPKVLTLWLDFGAENWPRKTKDEAALADKRNKVLSAINRFFAKYFDRVPSYLFYSALPQIISRITHPNAEIWRILCSVLTRIVTNYPNQALWSILAVVKASERLRVERGLEVLNRIKDSKNKFKSGAGSSDLRLMIAHSQKLSDGLLTACETQIKDRVSEVSLSKDLGFSHKLAPSQLVVPIESTLTASGPTNGNGETIRHHKPFVHDKITISSFIDEVLVLSSLQRPRKVTVRGSDGKMYGLLCKPKDDLRKDQRLMEFNTVINRALKRDAESSKRRLYIKTYAVMPLSEESGTIEWVEGIKPLRDILLNLYTRKGIRPNYHEVRNTLQEAITKPENLHLFRDKILSQYPATLHEWFAEVYPEPDSWFTARLRYSRSAAVMSMTGHVLGLGDRHGENILLEEGTGGVFHVDFNCLFDKGLTFEKPELVPFRLTHNMVDAMGPYGYEGPFRKSSEVTLRLLRQSKDTLMTVLETFLYDPTTDFVGKKKRTIAGVPETPAEILDSVESKLKGLFYGETVPLSVEGYVDVLVRQATDDFNLASMYIGWCAFL